MLVVMTSWHVFNPRTWEEEAGRGISVSLKPAWSTQWAPGQATQWDPVSTLTHLPTPQKRIEAMALSGSEVETESNRIDVIKDLLIGLLRRH